MVAFTVMSTVRANSEENTPLSASDAVSCSNAQQVMQVQVQGVGAAA